MKRGLNGLAWLALACAATLATWTGAANAQESAQSYPSKPIRIIVTFPAGGPTDIVARAIGQKLQEAWGQPVLIDNRPGAGGNIGMAVVAKSPPDGYTLVLSSFGPVSISPFVYSKLSYDPIKDLAPITLATTSAFFLVVNPEVPANSLKEFIAFAKARPGLVTMASSGIATPSHLAAMLFQSVAGVSVSHVPYKGGAESIPAVVSGQVQAALENAAAVLPQVKAGKLRALVVASSQRSPLMPDVPSAKELGLPGLEVGSWYGFHAPAGTPPPIIAKLNAEMVKALRSPDLRKRFAEISAEPVGDTPAEFSAFIEADAKKWGKLIQAAGLKVE
jgi:tripartite-type tricarboxylate transporter receptor subunit TctC